jgi:low temperature requirement protein LtrA
MATLPIVSPDDQRVTFVELFFDLVFVFCITQVVTLLHGHVDAKTAGSALLVFWLVWWAWTQFTWALNAANTDHHRVQLATLLATAIAFLLAVGIPRALGDGALWFAVPYVAVRVVGLTVYYWVAWSNPVQRRAVHVFASISVTGLVAVLIGATAGGAAQYWWWAAAIGLDLVAAGIGGQQQGWNLHPDHFVERHGLIVIIALGETLIVAASGLIASPPGALATATGVLAVAITSGLWWTYFHYPRQLFEHQMTVREGNARSCMARDIFSVMHFPLLCGVIGMAAATEQALMHPDQPLAADIRLALGGGALLFIWSTGGAMWRVSGRPPVARAMLGLLAVAGVVAGGAVPIVAMGILLGVLGALAAIEHRPGALLAEAESSHQPAEARLG